MTTRRNLLTGLAVAPALATPALARARPPWLKARRNGGW